MITKFKIFEKEIDRTDRTINYKKGDYIFLNNEVQIIYEVGLIGWVGSGDKKGEKVIRFYLYNEYDEPTSITLYENDIVLPTDEQIDDFKNSIEEWNEKHSNDWKYSDALSWIYNNFGLIPQFSMFLGSYNGQVCNGGHAQYFDNGYASSNTGGWGSGYKDIEKHEELVKLFEELNLNSILPSGQKAYDIMKRFSLDIIDKTETCNNCGGNGSVDCSECDGNGKVDCDLCDGSGTDEDGESCDNCDGSGSIECGECGGKGYVDCEDCDGGEEVVENDVADQTGWEKLDSEWYAIYEDFMKEFDDYLKTLTLDDEKIEDLISIANGMQKYNI